jgi:hypothetical protein
MAIDINFSGEAKNLDCAFWIGKGKRYPKNPPPDLIAYCDSLYEISDTWMKKLLPQKDMPINTYISWKLSTSRSTLIDISAHSCFLPEIPSENPESLLARSIPSKQFIRDAKLAFNQRILDGCRSLRDPNYKGKPLPLWSIDMWDKMHEAADAQEIWKGVDTWLRSHTDNSARRAAIEECQGYLKILGWNSRLDIPAGRVDVSNLAPMLADVMIAGDIMDLMTESLSLKVKENKESREYEVVALRFMDEVGKLWKDRNKAPIRSKILMELESGLKTSKRKNLLFPVHLPNEKHYVGFKINFVEKAISYGE